MRDFCLTILKPGFRSLSAAVFLFCAVPAIGEPLAPPQEDLECQAIPGKPATSLCYNQPVMSYPDWFLVHDGRQESMSFEAANPHISSLSFSPSGRLLALISSGEGHPWLEVFDSSRLPESSALILLASWDPYPGWISIAGWDGETLLIESDVPLHQDFNRSAEPAEDMVYHFRWGGTPHGLQLISKELTP